MPTRRALLLAPLAWPVAAARAQEAVPPADRAAIAAVIAAQIQAFARDDAAAAHGYAAPAIRAMFPDPDRFLAMVRAGYAPVYRPRAYDMAEAEPQGPDVLQKVELTGPDGHPALAVYTMERQPDGSWRIAGCRLAPSERLGA